MGAQVGAIREAVALLARAGIKVSLFIDPDPGQVEASAAAGAQAVELHTGTFCEAWETPAAVQELGRLQLAAAQAAAAGLAVHAGHGLNVRNVRPVARIPQVEELNIGHALIGRAVFLGLKEAVAEMKAIIDAEVRPR